MRLLYPTVFFTGATVMVLEIAGTRLLSPFYGNTVYVWTSLICTALGFLALGYWLGGKAGRGLFQKTVLAAGVFAALTPKLAYPVLVLTDVLGPVWGSLAASILLFSVPMTLLGSVIPQAVSISTKKVGQAGEQAGKVYAASSLGSLSGAFLAGFVLVPLMGVSMIIYMFSAILIALSFLGCDRRLLIFSMVILFPSISPSPELLFDVDGPYGRVRVGEKDGMRFLLVDGATQSCARIKDMSLCYQYIGIMADARPPGEALIIGLGGGQLSKLMPDADTVEIDPEVVRAARMHFEYDGDPIVADGRSYLRNTDKKYSYIVLDALSGYTLPGHLVTKESFSLMRERLEPGGGVAVNIIARPDDDFSAAVHSTLKSVFPHVGAKYTSPDFGNVVFFASMEPIGGQFADIPEGIVLTDDYNPTDLMRKDIMIELRDENRRYLGQFIY